MSTRTTLQGAAVSVQPRSPRQRTSRGAMTMSVCNTLSRYTYDASRLAWR